MSGAPRTLDEIRSTILAMSFASTMGLEIEEAGNGVGVAAVNLSPAVAYNEVAFAGIAVSTVADVAAGAAAMASLPADVLPLTTRVDARITASTVGERLSARAVLRDESDDGVLTFDAVVAVRDSDGNGRECGAATVTLRIARRRTPSTSD